MNYEELAKEIFEFQIEMMNHELQRPLQEVSKGEMAVLGYLNKHSEGEGFMPSELSEHFSIVPSRITAITANLMKKGFVSKCYSKTDKRKYQVQITEKGKAFADEKYHSAISHTKHMLEELGEEDALACARIQKKIQESFKKSKQEKWRLKENDKNIKSTDQTV